MKKARLKEPTQTHPEDISPLCYTCSAESLTCVNYNSTGKHWPLARSLAIPKHAIKAVRWKLNPPTNASSKNGLGFFFFFSYWCSNANFYSRVLYVGGFSMFSSVLPWSMGWVYIGWYIAELSSVFSWLSPSDVGIDSSTHTWPWLGISRG